ncbi:MAG: OsmC family protein [Polyangiales bacterium]
MSENQTFTVSLELIENYRFQVDFGDFGQLLTDEPAPLGDGQGPNPGRLLAASVANCLAASLLFAVRKYKEEPGKVRAEVTGTMARVEGRQRITHMAVQLTLGNAAANIPHLERVLAQFEDFCVVTQSVRRGVEVAVTVVDSEGAVVKFG